VAIFGTRGVEQRGRELLANFVRSGGGLLVTAGPEVDPAIIREALQDVVQTTWRARDAAPLRFAPDDSRHPVFRVFGGVGTLGNVSFARSALVEAGSSADVVARYSDGTPALVEEAAGSGRLLVFASDLNNAWNDFPVQPAFVPFVHETLRHLAPARRAASEYIVGALPGEKGRTPGIVELPAAGQTTSGAPSSAARTISGLPVRVAINTDPRESDPSRMSAEAFKAGVSRLAATATRRDDAAQESRENGQRLWQYALALMIVGLAAEGAIGRRLG
jgi:hypothetical protein